MYLIYIYYIFYMQESLKKYKFVGQYPIDYRFLGSNNQPVLKCKNTNKVIKLLPHSEQQFLQISSIFEGLKQHLKHQHLVQYQQFLHQIQIQYKVKEQYKYQKNNVLIMEYLSNQTLIDIILLQPKILDEAIIRTLFSQILQGVKHLHTNGIYCLNLNPQNIIFYQDINLKIIGYLNFLKQKQELSKMYANIPYYAPQLFKGKLHHKVAADVYSLGILLLILNYRINPDIIIKNRAKKIYEVSKMLEIYKHKGLKLNEELNSLIDMMIQEDPEKRISIQNIENNGWYKKQKLSDQVLSAKLSEIRQHKKHSLKVRDAGIQFNLLNQKLFRQKQFPTQKHHLYIQKQKFTNVITLLDDFLKKTSHFIFSQDFNMKEYYTIQYQQSHYLSIQVINCNIQDIERQIMIILSRSRDGQHILVQFNSQEKDSESQWLIYLLKLKIQKLSESQI